MPNKYEVFIQQFTTSVSYITTRATLEMLSYPNHCPHFLLLVYSSHILFVIFHIFSMFVIWVGPGTHSALTMFELKFSRSKNWWSTHRLQARSAYLFLHLCSKVTLDDVFSKSAACVRNNVISSLDSIRRIFKMKMTCHHASQLLVLCFVLLRSVDAFHAGSRIMSSSSSLSMVATGIERKRVVIVGATGYIGKFVVKESIRRG